MQMGILKKAVPIVVDFDNIGLRLEDIKPFDDI